MYSCCSAEVLIRLEASYVSLTEHKQLIQQAISQQWSMRRYDARRCNLMRLQDAHSAWDAVPLDIMFGAVLTDIMDSRPKTLFMCTDNTTVPERGDVHKGPFSTKRFAFWLAEQGVCKQFIQGVDTGQCSIWTWQLDKRKALALRTKLSRQYNKRYNKLADKLPNPSTYSVYGEPVW